MLVPGSLDLMLNTCRPLKPSLDRCSMELPTSSQYKITLGDVNSMLSQSFRAKLANVVSHQKLYTKSIRMQYNTRTIKYKGIQGQRRMALTATK